MAAGLSGGMNDFMPVAIGPLLLFAIQWCDAALCDSRQCVGSRAGAGVGVFYVPAGFICYIVAFPRCLWATAELQDSWLRGLSFQMGIFVVSQVLPG